MLHLTRGLAGVCGTTTAQGLFQNQMLLQPRQRLRFAGMTAGMTRMLLLGGGVAAVADVAGGAMLVVLMVVVRV